MILVAGESLVDRITKVDGNPRDVLGGGPFNAARALASLGCETTFIGGISTDAFGDQIASALNASGVSLALPRVLEPTGIAHVMLDASGSATYEFSLADSACAQVKVHQVEAIADTESVSALHIGTLGLVLHPLADAVTELTHVVPTEGLCFVDPNCRPSLISDFSEYQQRLHQILTRADVVKVSTEDMQFIAPGEDPEVAAAGLCVGRTRVVLLTKGAHGVAVITRDGMTSVAAAPVKVVDTVGAGDVFGAAWLAWWLRSGRGSADLSDTDAVVRAADYGVQAAAWTVSHAGAHVPTLTDLERSAS